MYHTVRHRILRLCRLPSGIDSQKYSVFCYIEICFCRTITRGISLKKQKSKKVRSNMWILLKKQQKQQKTMHKMLTYVVFGDIIEV